MILKRIIRFIFILTFSLILVGCSRENWNDVSLSSKPENDSSSLAVNEDGVSLSEDNTDNKVIKNEIDNVNNTDNYDNTDEKVKDDKLDKEAKDVKEEQDKEDREGTEGSEDAVEAITADNNSSLDSDKSEDNSQMDSQNNEQDGASNSNNKQDIEEEQKLSELEELSKKLALQMSKGDFKETHDTLSPQVKLQLPMNILGQGWDETVADIGNYKSVREIRQEAAGTATVVYVILDYDNSGIQVLFSYSADIMLYGLWINFAPYEAIIDDDSFEDIVISFGDNKNPIEGMLTLPKNVKNPPVAILIHGSGNHDADETIGVNKPFRDLAYGLARKGIAVIRYKENVPKSFDKFTIQDDSLNGASHAIKYAQSCSKVDTDKIIIVGHSLGGMMAPKIAADNKEVDGIVSLAGSPRRLEDIIVDQVRILNKADKSISEVMNKLALAQAEAQSKKVKELKESSPELILGYPASYWYSLNQIDTPSIVKDLDIPILISQGSKDFQVYVDIDYEEWKELLRDKDNVTFRSYDNLNHLFMTSNGRMNVTEYNIKGTVEQKVIDDIAKWILRR